VTVLYLVRHAHAVWESDENRLLSDSGRADAVSLSNLLSVRPLVSVVL